MLHYARGASTRRAVVSGAVEMATERKRYENEGNGEENPHTLQGVMPQSPHCGLRIHQSGGQIEAASSGRLRVPLLSENPAGSVAVTHRWVPDSDLHDRRHDRPQGTR